MAEEGNPARTYAGAASECINVDETERVEGVLFLPTSETRSEREGVQRGGTASTDIELARGKWMVYCGNHGFEDIYCLLAWIEGQIPLVSSECAEHGISENISRATPKPRKPLKNATRNCLSAQSTLGLRRSARITNTSKFRDPRQKASVSKQLLRRSVCIAQRRSCGEDWFS